MVNPNPARPLVRAAAFKLDEAARAGAPTDAFPGLVAGVAGGGAKAPREVVLWDVPAPVPEGFCAANSIVVNNPKR